MVKIYVHNSIDDIYIVMVTENGYPVASDSLRGRIQLGRELNKLIREYKHKGSSYKVVGTDNIEDLYVYSSGFDL